MSRNLSLFLILTALLFACQPDDTTNTQDTVSFFDTVIPQNDTSGTLQDVTDTNAPTPDTANNNTDTRVSGDTSDALSQDTTVGVDTTPPPATLDVLLDALRTNNPDAAMQAGSDADGWPAPVDGGYLFVSTDPTLNLVAGDHDSWTGTGMTVESGFAWIVLSVADGSRYKFTDGGSRWQADPWSRAYHWDENGLMSQVVPAAGTAHLERFFNVTDGAALPRMVRIWIPALPATHVLYVHDGQNLFDPNAFFGGWKLSESAPAAMMLVGLDNTGAARMEEYTHVPDIISGNTPIGGAGDAYADYVQNHVRQLVATHYGEPARVGTMGSSLGGLISFHIVDRYPDEYDFAASLSGTMGWGSLGTHNDTLLERFDRAGKRSTALYLDSGGDVVGTCEDLDSDGIEDDSEDSDNYCTNKQFERILRDEGYVTDISLWHWWEQGAPHNEAAWAARVFRPLQIFAGL